MNNLVKKSRFNLQFVSIEKLNIFLRWKVGKWSKCLACKNLSGIRVRQVVCVEESPKPGSEDFLLDDDKCEEVKPATRELCDSHIKCRSTRYIDNIPKQLLKYLWKQTNSRISRNDAVSLANYFCNL